MQHLDVAGYNYMWYEYENDHQQDPSRIIYGSETVAQEAAVNWNLVEKHPYIIGDFVWTALDYLGESGIGHTLELSKGEKILSLWGGPGITHGVEILISVEKRSHNLITAILFGRKGK